MARKTGDMQATGPLFDEINRKAADAIGEAIQAGADPQTAISAAVITASDFAQLMFGEEALDDLKATLEMQRASRCPRLALEEHPVHTVACHLQGSMFRLGDYQTMLFWTVIAGLVVLIFAVWIV